MKQIDECIDDVRHVGRVYTRREAIEVCDPKYTEYPFLGSDQPSSRGWDMNVGYSGAYKALREGIDLPREFRGSITLPDYQLDVSPRHQVRIADEGDEFLADRYFDRQEEYYLDVTPQIAEGMSPVVNVIVGIVASAGVSASNIFHRAGAIYRLIQAIEASGFTARVVASSTVHVGGGGRWHVGVIAKDSSEMASPKQLAAFFHPAFFRRIIFRLYEIEPEKIRDYNRCGNGYGYPDPSPATGRKGEMFDKLYGVDRRIYLAAPDSYHKYFDADTAMKLVSEQYEREIAQNRAIVAKAA